MSIIPDNPKQFDKEIKKLPFKEVFLGNIKGYPGHRVDDISSEFDLLDDEREQWLYYGTNSFIKSYSTGTLVPYTKAIKEGVGAQAAWFAACNAMRELLLANLNSKEDSILLNLSSTLNLISPARYRIEEQIRELLLSELDDEQAFSEFDVINLNKVISSTADGKVLSSNTVSVDKVDKLLTFLSSQMKWIRDYYITIPLMDDTPTMALTIGFTSNIFAQLREIPQFYNADSKDKLVYIYDLIGPILEGLVRYSMNRNFIHACPKTSQSLDVCFLLDTKSAIWTQVKIPPVWLGYNLASTKKYASISSAAQIEFMWHNKERYNLKEVNTGCKTIRDVFSY